MTQAYSPPVDQLLALGEDPARQYPWIDYLALGLTKEHVPELLRMLDDPALQEWDGTPPRFWPVVHAWRALGQLRAPEAVEPLARRMAEVDPDDDWTENGVPIALRMIGAPSIPALRRLAAREDVDPWVNHAALETLGGNAKEWPEARDRVVEVLTAFLRRWPEQDGEFNAFVVSSLMDARATEAAPLMAEAFAADAVDLQLAGDWEDVQIELGLLAERTTPRRPIPLFRLPAGGVPRSAPKPRPRAKAKHQRQEKKAARRRNRRK